MEPRWLFAAQVLAYAAFPLYFAVSATKMRLALLYLYVGVVLTVGGFLGSVHGYPLTDGVTISSGSVAYGALMMSTVVLVLVGNDVQVVRNVVRIVVVVNVFKVVLYGITAEALRSDEFPNPFETSASVFSVSLRVVLVGGALIVAELLLLLAVFERLKTAIRRPGLLRVAYVVCFVGALCIDGVLFPLLASPTADGLGEIVRAGVHAKFVLALAFAVPLLGFLAAFRSSMAAYEATPLRLQELFFAPREEIITELQRERAARRASDRQLQASEALSRAMALVDRTGPIREVLSGLGDVLQQVPGVRAAPLGLIVAVDDTETVEIGPPRVGTTPISPAQLAARAAAGPWSERRELEDVVCLPVGPDGEFDAVLEVGVEREQAPALLASLGDLGVQAAAVLRPAVLRLRTRWRDRAPIRTILDNRAADAVFQPVVSLADGTVVGYEGLTRFEPDASPELRFREAAGLGLGVDLELLAVRTIVSEAAGLPPGLPVSLNVSPGTVLDPAFAGAIRGTDRSLKVEVTEHEPVDDYPALAAALADLGDVQLTIDDAGSGYASLQHILRLRPHEVKLDRSWVAGIDRDRPRQVLVGGLCSFVGEIGAAVVAEGIEEPEEAEVLRELGVHFGQGFLFGRPAPAATFSSIDGSPVA